MTVNRSMDASKFGGWEIFGAIVVVTIVLLLSINGTIGWDWSDNAAAWVQAVGSVVAVVVALIAPYVHARAQRRAAQFEQLDMLRTVVNHAKELSVEALSATTSHGSMLGYTEFVFSPKSFERIAILLDRLPHHAVQPPTLIPHLLSVQTVVEGLPHTIRWISDAMETMNSDPDEGIEALKEANRQLEIAYEAIDDAFNQFNYREHS